MGRRTGLPLIPGLPDGRQVAVHVDQVEVGDSGVSHRLPGLLWLLHEHFNITIIISHSLELLTSHVAVPKFWIFFINKL